MGACIAAFDSRARRCTFPPVLDPPAPAPRPPSPLARQRTSWLRWIDALARGPLAGLVAKLDLARPLAAEAADAWVQAVREISARLVLAGVRERIVPGGLRGGALVADIPDGALSLPLARVRAFELHRADLDHADDPRLGDPLGLAATLSRAEGVDDQAVARIVAEIADSVENLAQARLARVIREGLARLPDAPSDARLHDPEHFVTDGHPWHPMTRTRLGLTRADRLRHGPELLATTTVRCVDVDAGIVRRAGIWDELAPICFGEAPPGRVRLPLHPVQLRRLAKLFPKLVASGALVPAQLRLSARSLLSLRTVCLLSTHRPTPTPLHLKLGLGVLTTSARRVVSAMSVQNGPVVTALLEAIQAADPPTRRLELMPEPAAAGLEPEVLDAAVDTGQLGAILRLAPRAVLAAEAGEQAWVCAAIGERWPGTEELVLERACAAYPGGRGERLRALLDDWIDGLVEPALRLLVAHGVVLELHLQNTLAIVAAGRLRGFVVRDLGGIRLHGPRLRAAGHELGALDPSSFIVTDDLEEVRGKLEHTLFHAHFAHLFEVAAELGVPEAESWARLREAVGACLDRWIDDHRVPERVRAAARSDRERLLAARVRAKALLRMRMHERFSDYDYTEVQNALSEAPG